MLKQPLEVAIQQGNKHEVSVALREFKLQNGAVNYPAILSIPVKQRLPEMAKNDFSGTSIMVGAGITMAMETMNLKNPLLPIQIVDLSEMIIDSAAEDNLSLEDVMLFLQKLVRGEYGKFYESMDIPKFMDFFEMYREQRHNALMQIRKNRHLEFKGLGDGNRTTTKDDLDEHFASITGRLSDLKERLKEKMNEPNE